MLGFFVQSVEARNGIVLSVRCAVVRWSPSTNYMACVLHTGQVSMPPGTCCGISNSPGQPTSSSTRTSKNDTGDEA